MQPYEHDRIVLFPQGQPVDSENRDLCARFFLGLGGDLGRVMDGPFAHLDHFVRYISRISAIKQANRPPIVILTSTIPLPLMVINVRRKLEQAIPELKQATWVLFVDPERDPFFVQSASQLGELKRDAADSAVWLGPLDTTYMLAGPVCEQLGAHKR